MAFKVTLTTLGFGLVAICDANSASQSQPLLAFVTTSQQKNSRPLLPSLHPSPSLPSILLQAHHPTTKTSKDDGEIDPIARINRRKWLEDTIKWGVAASAASPSVASFLQPPPALADTSTIPNPTAATQASSAVCDPSVSTFTKNNRVVHILGTAHISSDSAQLAGKLVREVTPKAVFLELDKKRVARALPTDESDTPSSETSTEQMMIGGADSDPTSGLVDRNSQVDPLPPQKKSNPFNLKEKILQASTDLVGNAIKSLYRKLESDGFSAGEEFAIAAREGIALGSAIVLGDQDVDITLRRLTEALSKTDIKKLLAADSELEQNMKGFVPDGVALASSPGAVKSGAGDEESGMSKEQFVSFVETMKAKENVSLLMGNLKAVAPEVYNAMVGERDEYMARGLDKLQYESTVAVMGIAHVEGVERYLQANGWVEKPAACSLRS